MLLLCHSVTNGALSDFAATSSTVYTATFTPMAEGLATIDVAASTFTDAVGNNNTAATQFTWTYDITAPTMTITAAEGADGFTSNDATLSLTFTSSEPTTDFVEEDITVTNGALSSFSATSSTVYTATFTPGSEEATIDVAASTFTDAAGNNNTAATQFNWTYEPTIWHVATTGSDATGDGSEANPFATIQHGIDAASGPDTVLVAAGTYVENIIWPETNGIKLIGTGHQDCVIEGEDGQSSVVSIGIDFSYSIIDTFTLISGFQITNGFGIGDSGSGRRGGGIYLVGSSPKIMNTYITQNQAHRGAGIYLVVSNPVIENTAIVNNSTTSGWGGGIHNEGGMPSLKNVNITGNSAGVGGAVEGDAIMVNCIIRDNGSPQFWDLGLIQATYSNIEGGHDGEGNIDVDPLFCSIIDEDFSLAENSPCVGTGYNGENMGAFGIGCAPHYDILVITEIMKDPSLVDDSNGEWFEILNNGTRSLQLSGWTIEDLNTDMHTISQSIELDIGEYFVLGNNDNYDSNGGVDIGYQYSSITLQNSSDAIIIKDNERSTV